MPAKPYIIPCLLYRDAPAAIDFLCTAFGFERREVHVDPNDASIVVHAQLTLGDAMIMLSSQRADPGREKYRFRTPQEAGGVTTCICVAIDDPDAHYARAKAAGAVIVTPPHDNAGYPGRSYNCFDGEGHNWDFSTYDPLAG